MVAWDEFQTNLFSVDDALQHEVDWCCLPTAIENATATLRFRDMCLNGTCKVAKRMDSASVQFSRPRFIESGLWQQKPNWTHHGVLKAALQSEQLLVPGVAANHVERVSTLPELALVLCQAVPRQREQRKMHASMRMVSSDDNGKGIAEILSI